LSFYSKIKIAYIETKVITRNSANITKLTGTNAILITFYYWLHTLQKTQHLL